MGAEKSDEGKPSSFKVSDRRIFSEGGDAKAKAETTPASATGGPAPTEQAHAAPTTSAAGDLPPVDFHTFILSLGSSALLHLGELDQPDGAESPPDLRMAKHTIDIIAMLQTKTKGNLSSPEERLIESLLYDLRLRFVERSKTGGA
ncbi:MAG: DUF1844 domain-containing protein [Bacteroidota bacterium]